MGELSRRLADGFDRARAAGVGNVASKKVVVVLVYLSLVLDNVLLTVVGN